jgi:flavin-dependent dehydrogenase
MELCHRGISTALIEQDNYRTFRVGETLPPIIRTKLKDLGVWERFLACDPLESYGIRSAWETSAPEHQDFLRNPYGCGWHVDRARFDGMLASAAAEAGAELMVSACVRSCQRTAGDQWEIEVAQGATMLTLTGRRLVDATGRRALLASRLGTQTDVVDHLVGVVALAPHQEAERWTLIEAMESGWWYSAPLPGGRTVFAFMTDADLWKAANWADLLRSAPLTSQRAGSAGVPSPTEIVSAGSLIRQPVAGPDWIAIGDAALAFDPLSGQGVLNSMETGTQSACAIERHFNGDSDSLAEYQNWVEKIHQDYLDLRHRFYGRVRRWSSTSPFWKRRAAV